MNLSSKALKGIGYFFIACAFALIAVKFYFKYELKDIAPPHLTVYTFSITMVGAAFFQMSARKKEQEDGVEVERQSIFAWLQQKLKG